MGYSVPGVNETIIDALCEPESLPNPPTNPNYPSQRNQIRENIANSAFMAMYWAQVSGPGTNRPEFLTSDELAGLPAQILAICGSTQLPQSWGGPHGADFCVAIPAVVKKLVTNMPAKLGGGPSCWTMTFVPAELPGSTTPATVDPLIAVATQIANALGGTQ